MKEHEAHLLGETVPEYSPEELVIQRLFDLDPADLEGDARAQYEATVMIVSQFSRTNPENGAREMISPGRIRAIPAITSRYMHLQKPARGVLGLEDVLYAWQDNMPENDGLRHPDLLFDMAQMNFGTDAPVQNIERNIMRAELQRRQMIAEYRSHMRMVAAQYRNERPLDDDADEQSLEAFIDDQIRP